MSEPTSKSLRIFQLLFHPPPITLVCKGSLFIGALFTIWQNFSLSTKLKQTCNEFDFYEYNLNCIASFPYISFLYSYNLTNVYQRDCLPLVSQSHCAMTLTLRPYKNSLTRKPTRVLLYLFLFLEEYKQVLVKCIFYFIKYSRCGQD